MFVRKQSYVCPFCETKRRWSAYRYDGKPTCAECGFDMYPVEEMPKSCDATIWKRLRAEFVRKRWRGGYAAFDAMVWLTSRKGQRVSRSERWWRRKR